MIHELPIINHNHKVSNQIGLMETAKRCREQDQQHPDWFADTYDLKSEIVSFVAAFEQRKQQAVDNHWILKGEF